MQFPLKVVVEAIAKDMHGPAIELTRPNLKSSRNDRYYALQKLVFTSVCTSLKKIENSLT